MENQKRIEQNWLDCPVIKAFPGFSREKLIITLIIILAILSRFLLLGNRVMSHDEVNHVVPAYNLYKGMGYAHDPVTHGPFQFHVLALAYFLFGDNDFASRVPAALFSVAAIIFVIFAFKRYLGRIGALIGGVLFLISPFLLFYGRYTRNEGFIELFAVMTLYGLLRYFEKRDHFSLYLIAVVTALQFVTKEVAFIYTAQFLLFCGILLVVDLWKILQSEKKNRRKSLLLLFSTALLFIIGVMVFSLNNQSENPDRMIFTASIVLSVIGGLGFIAAIAQLLLKIGWLSLRELPAFNLIVFVGALILPQLTAFPVKLIGWDPLDYSAQGMLRTGIFLAILFVISLLIGYWWYRKLFLKAAALFYLIFVTFYTTFFSNGQGFFTGIIGSLGYWLSQQEVQRGGQPFYYYGMILIPLYEFLSVAGTIAAIYFASKYHKFFQKPCLVLSESFENDKKNPDDEKAVVEPEKFPNVKNETVTEPDSILQEEKASFESNFTVDLNEIKEPGLQPLWQDGKIPTLTLFFFWSLSALLAYSIAGEKMPWLTVHIAIPLALSAAWGIGYLLETIAWKKIISWYGLAALAGTITGIFALIGIDSSIRGAVKPFSGKELTQLKSTNQFILSAIVLITVIIFLVQICRKWFKKDTFKFYTLLLIGILAILQARTAYNASFINYDYANELLVYAHAGPGPKIALKQIEEIAARTGQGKTIKVAYDNDALYPYWWYFRDYSSKFYFGEDNPTRELRNYDVIIANTTKESRLKPIVQNGYYRFEYIRLWWPNQDYWNLTPARIVNALLNPDMRSALFDIWLNRDYKKYAQVTGSYTLTKETWEPSARMVVYMKKDLLQKMWSLGNIDDLSQPQDDETEYISDEKFSEIDPFVTIGSQGVEQGQFTAPRGVAVSKSGRIYVLDSDNHRVQYFSKTGEFLGMWNAAERGGFNQPWGIAVGPDGSVYVADTWNHRMLKFDENGTFLTEWYANDPADITKSFYGPRSVAVDSNGRVFVSDTGNKRIMIYDQNGNFIDKFGTPGMGTGELDEPVGIALFEDKRLAVADTWNQRVQIFDVEGAHPTYQVVASFEVQAWYSQSLDNKPYIAYLPSGNILITDPEGYLVWEYTPQGELIRSWNGGGGNIDNTSMPTGISVDAEGSVWVVDTFANHVNQFVLPELKEK